MNAQMRFVFKIVEGGLCIQGFALFFTLFFFIMHTIHIICIQQQQKITVILDIGY